MSLNQFTQPNTYIPAVYFSDMKCDNVDIGNFDLPCNFSSDRTSTPDNRIAMLSSGTNTVVSLQTNLPGAGCFIQFSNPNGDNDFQLGVSNTNENFMSLKQDLHVRDENFLSSMVLNKTPGQGILINNPSIPNYNATNLTCYEEKFYPPTALTGFVGSPNLDVSAVRVGSVVTLNVSNISGQTALGGIIQCTVLEPRFCPQLLTEVMIATVSNGAPEVGRCSILPGGQLQFEYTPGTLFPNQPLSGWGAFSVSYNVL